MFLQKLQIFSILIFVLTSVLCDNKRSDDVSDQSLQNLIQQQASLIDTLQAKVTVLERQVAKGDSRCSSVENQLATLNSRVQKRACGQHGLSSGHLLFKVKGPKQKVGTSISSAFSVVLSSGPALNVGENSAIKFDNVLTNIGNAYDPHSGLFKAPFSGIYSFSLHARSVNDHHWIGIGIYKDETMLATTNADGDSDLYDKASCNAIVYLNVGEHVHVQRVDGDFYIERGWLTNFSGFSVSAD